VATRTIPIISYNLETDPLAEGYAKSLASPGGNVTGIFFDFPNFAAKLIELLVEVTGKLSRVAVFWEPSTGPVQVESAKAAAQALKLEFEVLETKVASDYGPAYADARQRGADGAVLLSSPLVVPNAGRLVELALEHRLPTITTFPEYARVGGLLAYGPNLLTMYRQAGIIAAKAMRGVDVANLPIERPTKFELVVNQRAAVALGLSIQATLVLRADEVID
jgi:putative ABC transport system substrate-binding protein